MQKIFLHILALVSAVLFFIGSKDCCLAASRETPIQIEADRMESDGADNMVLFTGRVDARQGDLVINADRMTVYYQDPSAGRNSLSGSGQKIEKIIAENNVKIANDELSATGDRAEFAASDQRVKLIGNTRVWKSNNVVTGQKIEIDLETGTCVIERGDKPGERITGIFYPGSGDTAPKEAP